MPKFLKRLREKFKKKGKSANIDIVKDKDSSQSSNASESTPATRDVPAPSTLVPATEPSTSSRVARSDPNLYAARTPIFPPVPEVFADEQAEPSEASVAFATSDPIVSDDFEPRPIPELEDEEFSDISHNIRHSSSELFQLTSSEQEPESNSEWGRLANSTDTCVSDFGDVKNYCDEPETVKAAELDLYDENTPSAVHPTYRSHIDKTVHFKMDDFQEKEITLFEDDVVLHKSDKDPLHEEIPSPTDNYAINLPLAQLIRESRTEISCDKPSSDGDNSTDAGNPVFVGADVSEFLDKYLSLSLITAPNDEDKLKQIDHIKQTLQAIEDSYRNTAEGDHVQIIPEKEDDPALNNADRNQNISLPSNDASDNLSIGDTGHQTEIKPNTCQWDFIMSNGIISQDAISNESISSEPKSIISVNEKNLENVMESSSELTYHEDPPLSLFGISKSSSFVSGTDNEIVCLTCLKVESEHEKDECPTDYDVYESNANETSTNFQPSIVSEEFDSHMSPSSDSFEEITLTVSANGTFTSDPDLKLELSKISNVCDFESKIEPDESFSEVEDASTLALLDSESDIIQSGESSELIQDISEETKNEEIPFSDKLKTEAATLILNFLLASVASSAVFQKDSGPELESSVWSPSIHEKKRASECFEEDSSPDSPLYISSTDSMECQVGDDIDLSTFSETSSTDHSIENMNRVSFDCVHDTSSNTPEKMPEKCQFKDDSYMTALSGSHSVNQTFDNAGNCNDETNNDVILLSAEYFRECQMEDSLPEESPVKEEFKTPNESIEINEGEENPTKYSQPENFIVADAKMKTDSDSKYLTQTCHINFLKIVDQNEKRLAASEFSDNMPKKNATVFDKQPIQMLDIVDNKDVKSSEEQKDYKVNSACSSNNSLTSYIPVCSDSMTDTFPLSSLEDIEQYDSDLASQETASDSKLESAEYSQSATSINEKHCSLPEQNRGTTDDTLIFGLKNTSTVVDETHKSHTSCSSIEKQSESLSDSKIPLEESPSTPKSPRRVLKINGEIMCVESVERDTHMPTNRDKKGRLKSVSFIQKNIMDSSNSLRLKQTAKWEKTATENSRNKQISNKKPRDSKKEAINSVVWVKDVESPGKDRKFILSSGTGDKKQIIAGIDSSGSRICANAKTESAQTQSMLTVEADADTNELCNEEPRELTKHNIACQPCKTVNSEESEAEPSLNKQKKLSVIVSPSKQKTTLKLYGKAAKDSKPMSVHLPIMSPHRSPTKIPFLRREGREDHLSADLENSTDSDDKNISSEERLSLNDDNEAMGDVDVKGPAKASSVPKTGRVIELPEAEPSDRHQRKLSVAVSPRKKETVIKVYNKAEKGTKPVSVLVETKPRSSPSKSSHKQRHEDHGKKKEVERRRNKEVFEMRLSECRKDLKGSRVIPIICNKSFQFTLSSVGRTVSSRERSQKHQKMRSTSKDLLGYERSVGSSSAPRRSTSALRKDTVCSTNKKNPREPLPEIRRPIDRFVYCCQNRECVFNSAYVARHKGGSSPERHHVAASGIDDRSDIDGERMGSRGHQDVSSDRAQDHVMAHRDRRRGSAMELADLLKDLPSTFSSSEDLETKLDEGFSKYSGKERNYENLITFKRCTEWLRSAGILGGEVSEDDAGYAFKKTAKSKVALNKDEYRRFLKKLSRLKKINYDEICERLCSISANCKKYQR